MSRLSTPLLVMDLETTGLPRSRWAMPCELAFSLLDRDGEEVATFEALVRVPTPPEADHALQLTGITREEIAAAPGEAEVCERLRGWLETLPAGRRVTSFNVGFDAPMFGRLTFKPAVFLGAWAPCIMLAAHRVMDRDPACPLPRWPSGEAKWPTLAEAAAYLGVEVQLPQHRALGDARTAARIALALSDRAHARSGQ